MLQSANNQEASFNDELTGNNQGNVNEVALDTNDESAVENVQKQTHDTDVRMDVVENLMMDDNLSQTANNHMFDIHGNYLFQTPPVRLSNGTYGPARVE